MNGNYRENHYVPQWYQKRFMLPGQTELYRRDLRPEEFRDGHGKVRGKAAEVWRLGPRQCFVERDLYTTYLGSAPSVEIERLFFGKIDRAGKAAVEAFATFTVGAALAVYGDLLNYMGTQKFRTPKGLAWLSAQGARAKKNEVLARMVTNRRMYHAIWSECVWQVADASLSPTKFIVTDHPVTVYNRHCGPSSQWCRGHNDPDIRLTASHTIFPLSLDKVLILTNLTWARNPYQDPMRMRPNPKLTRTGVFKAMAVQSDRHLEEREVLEINFIARSRATRYIAAADPEWLYPERSVSKSDWRDYGGGYLLMPDPRALHMGGTVYMMDGQGRVFAADEYGRLPGEPGFEDEAQRAAERVALYRFKGEFARLNGPDRRGRITGMGGGLEPATDSPDLHAYHLEEEARNKRLMKGARKW